MWEFDYKEGWAPKNRCSGTVVLEKTLESPLNCKEIKLVNPKGHWPWILIGRTDGEADASILWPPDTKSLLIRKDPDAGEDWRQKQRATEDAMVGWHHRFNGHELGQTPVDGEGPGSLVCCSPWCHEESNTTWWLNNNSLINPGLSEVLPWKYIRVIQQKWDIHRKPEEGKPGAETGKARVGKRWRIFMS